MWIAICIVLVVLTGLIIFLVMPGRGCEKTRQDFRHLNLAHRGLHTKDKKIPENSLAAFGRAADAGYGIELDLQLSKDGQIVVFHDDTLKRVCGIDGRVDDFTYDQLCAFRLCGTKERIPLFSEVLKLVDGRVPLLVEFKNGPRNDMLCEKTLPMLREYKGIFCIESFSPFIVRWFRKNAPDIMRGQLASTFKEMKSDVPGWQAFLLSNCFLNCIARPHFIAYYKEKHSPIVKLAEAFGATKAVWTVRPDCDIERLKQTNDIIIFELCEPEIRY